MDKNILYYYEELNRSILIVEKEENNLEALNSVEYNFSKVFEYISMFLIMKKDRYYGCILMNMNMKMNFYSNAIASVSIDTSPYTLETNPLLLGKYSIKEIIFIIAHEIEHLVLNHPTEAIKIDIKNDPAIHMRLNYAMDASVNDRLMFDIEENNLDIMKKPNNSVISDTISKLCNYYVEKLKDFEYYYQELPNPEILHSINEIPKYECHIVTSKNRQKGIVFQKWTESDDADEIRDNIHKNIEKSLESLSEEERFLLPGYQKEALDKLLSQPKILWSQMLKRYVGTVPSSKRKTKTRLSRRQPERYDISGEIEDKIIKVVVAIDTSASMSEEMLNDIFVEIFEILKSIKYELTIIECDSKIHRIYRAKILKDIDTNVVGRGGTSYIPVIEYINSERYFRDSVLVYFTDGYGDTNIPKPKVKHILWVLTGGSKTLSLYRTYGKIITIN